MCDHAGTLFSQMLAILVVQAETEMCLVLVL